MLNESLRRHAELEIHAMPDLGRFAMPKDSFREAVKLAESGNESDRSVAHYMADASRDTLMAPFKDWHRAKLGMSVETQRFLAGIGTNSLLEYMLGRDRFEKAEQIFLDDVKEVLLMHKQRTAAEMRLTLAWRYPQYPPPVLRMVA